LIEADRIIAPHLDSRSFITVTYALVDPSGRTMACARAGHCPFLRVASGSSQAEMLAPDGMILGLNLDRGERFERHLEEVTIPLNAGDVFLFYTDGVSDAMDPAGDYFGDERLMASLAAYANEPADSILSLLAGNITAFVRGQAQHDDITMIILKIDG
jgi:sigma-B regulation protein RsbU (phosphoserine phosphatase)